MPEEHRDPVTKVRVTPCTFKGCPDPLDPCHVHATGSGDIIRDYFLIGRFDPQDFESAARYWQRRARGPRPPEAGRNLPA